MTTRLLSPVEIGSLRLANRMVMAPMTRLRAVGGLPNALIAEYYAQLASAGLIVTECAMVEPRGQGYINCPGVYADLQVEGWAGVVDAVHARRGRIFLQLWHCGRVSHPSLQPGGGLPVGPSPVAAEGELFTPAGKVSPPAPRELSVPEIADLVGHFEAGARGAKAAGFDGVELHGAFGYLIDQFLQDGSNRRTDTYGGTVDNRCRFCLEVVDAVLGVWGADRVGLKLSPSNTYYAMSDSDPGVLFDHLLGELSFRPLAYVHLMEPSAVDFNRRAVLRPVVPRFRPHYRGRIIANGGFDRDGAEHVLRSGDADLVSFGKPFLANPDLPARFAIGSPLNAPDPATFYGAGLAHAERGYTDYPRLAATEPSPISAGIDR